MTRPGPTPRAVAVVGLGCIGGSVALGLRRALPGLTLLGVDRDRATLDAARAAGAIDRAVELAAAAGEADLVVLAVPVLEVGRCLEALAGAGAAPGRRALVTDTASSKALVCRWGRRWLGDDGFLGGHPMAGRERSGFGAASGDLFRGRTWALTPTAPGQPAAFGPWLACLEALEARPLVLPPERHDALVARTSHLPLVLAAVCAAAAAEGAAPDPLAERLVGSGFRDVARMAAGDPTMAAHIAASNAGPLDDALAAAERELARLRGGLRRVGRGSPPDAGDADVLALREWFAAARAALERLEPGGPPDAG